jgi:hypothetical protein
MVKVISTKQRRLERMKSSSYDPTKQVSVQNLALTGKSYCQTDGLALGKIINYFQWLILPRISNSFR